MESWRSLLFAPADNERRLRRALDSDADVIVLDLEDAVAPAAKPAARDALRRLDPELLRRRPVVLRVNGTDSPFHADDMRLVEEVAGIDRIMLPKASVESLDRLDASRTGIIALIETAAGVEQSGDIARDERVARLMLGSADLAADLGVELSYDEVELAYPRARLTMASAAAGIPAPIDAVYLSVRDPDGLARSTARGRAYGFAAKACIHPDQVAIVNEALTPDVESIERARRIVALAEQMHERQDGAVLDDEGRLIDLPVIKRAHRLLARARDSKGAEYRGSN